uniref:ShKT domain-containing protein n=1 Tax=Ditylenchus dipsaci TaxID=166011 RepID=A0A915EF21_9BILA
MKCSQPTLPLIFNGGVLEFTTEAVSSTSTPSSTSTITSTTVATTTAVEPELQARGTKSSKLDPTSPTSQPENEKCADNAENCVPNIIYCKQGGYISLMQKHCSKTCGLCKKEITKIGTTPHHPVFSRPLHRERSLTKLRKGGHKKVENDGEQCEDTSPRCGLWNGHNFCKSKFFQLNIKKKVLLENL